MRKIISADYLVKHNYKGYVILKRKSFFDHKEYYAIYYHKILKGCVSSLKMAKLTIDGWNNDDQDN